MYDEVEAMLISVNVPKPNKCLTDVCLALKLKDGTKETFNWVCIESNKYYGVNINIGDYVSFSEKIQKAKKGDLDSYYVLRDNLAKSQEQFKDVPRMLKAFEWFGPYPFMKTVISW
jgi:hypothetical protein